MSKVLMRALIAHAVGSMRVGVGQTFEVEEAEARDYERRTSRPLAERVGDSDGEPVAGTKRNRTTGLLEASDDPADGEEFNADAIPESFPGRAALEAAGVTSLEAVKGMDRDALIALGGIGDATADKILEASK